MIKNKIIASLLALSGLLSVMPCGAYAEEAKDENSIKRAQYLVESTGKWATGAMSGKNRPTGWDIDTRGGSVTENNGVRINISDTSDIYPVVMTHSVDKRTKGVITFEAKFIFKDAMDGFSLELNDDTGKNALEFGIENTKLIYKDKKRGKATLGAIEENQFLLIKAVIDIDQRTAELSYNGALIGEYGFSGDAEAIADIRLKTPEKDEMELQLIYISIYENYLINEGFTIGTLPYDWELIAEDENSIEFSKVQAGIEQCNLIINDTNIIDSTIVRKEFPKTSGRLAFEFRETTNDVADKVTVRLKNGEENALLLSFDKGVLKTGSGEEIVKVKPKLWNYIRIEPDTEKQTALIKYNGRKLKEISFTNHADGIDALEFATTVKGRTTFTIRDIVGYKIPDLPADYPTPPVIPQKRDDRINCMQVCDLWHENHMGWEPISAEDERKPILGWYDDTHSEVSDWEIKWLAEHGIDAVLKCWYMEEGNYTGVPLLPVGSRTAMNAFYNAEYADYMKYGLLVCSYPAANDPVNHWRDAMIPYWIENFMSDPRYLVVDNKPVIFFFGHGAFEKVFGSPQAVREQLNYLREEFKKIGYDGAYLVSYCRQTADGGAEMRNAKECGFDYAFCYSWGKESYKAEYQIDCMQSQQDMGILDAIPTVTMGYNMTAWDGGVGVPYATKETFTEVCNWVDDVLMPGYGEDSLAGRMVTFDNWNEFGEGHFIFPTGVNGFGYLDAAREVFTNANTDHSDSFPTDAQKERVGALFPKDRKYLRYIDPLQEEYPTKVKKGWYFNNPSDYADWKVEKQVDPLKNEDGSLIGTTNNTDGGIVMVNDIKVDISNSPYVKVRMKQPKGATSAVEMFFTTEQNNSWTQLQSAKCDIDPSGEFVDYYLRIGVNKYWDGILNKIRLDPTNASGVEFRIESIEILENETAPVTLIIDGEKRDYEGAARNINGTTYIPLRPHIGWQDPMYIYAEYDNGTKELTLENEGKTILFTVGSDKAVVNGYERQLPAPVEIMNNLPLVPVRLIAETFGDSVSWNGELSAIEIITDESQRVDESAIDDTPRVPNQWEFNTKNDLEGWQASEYSFSRRRVKDGYLNLKSTNTDPIIQIDGIDVDASKYKTINVRVKNETNSNTMEFYFASSVTGGIAANKCVRKTISVMDEDFVEYSFDMSANENWQGKITSLRFDPIGSAGTIKIDYIRVEE